MGSATEPDMSTYLGVDLTHTLGPLFWGTLVSMALTGIAILQAYQYFPSKDRTVVKLIALSMILLDLGSSALAAHGLYHYLLPNFGSTIPLHNLVPTLAAECVVTTCIIAISQLYFAWQVSALAQKRFVKYVVSWTVAILSLLAFAGGLGCSTVMFVNSTHILASRNTVFDTLAGIAKAPAALADIIATSSLCYSLGYVKTGVKSTDSVLKTLIGFAIERCLLVTVIQIAFLIVLYTSSPHLYWLGLHVNVTRLYANTFFAMLNGRDKLRREYQARSFIASGLESYNRSDLEHAFPAPKKGTNRESDAAGAPQSMWMDVIKQGSPTDSRGVAQIQVDQRVVVSNI